MAIPKALERAALSALGKLRAADAGTESAARSLAWASRSRVSMPSPLGHGFDSSVLDLYRILLGLYGRRHPNQTSSAAPLHDKPRLASLCHDVVSVFAGVDFYKIPLTDIARLYENLLQHVSEADPDQAAPLEKRSSQRGDSRLQAVRRRGRSYRKSSGSYYTPDRVIPYVVKSTLGPIVDGKRGYGAGSGPLNSGEILRLKIFDPAMGSGLFLLEAMDYLADAYARALVREGRTAGVEDASEMSNHRVRIARHCLFGMDIDPVAVEIATLCLGASLVGSATPPAFLEGRPHIRGPEMIHDVLVILGLEKNHVRLHTGRDRADPALHTDRLRGVHRHCP